MSISPEMHDTLNFSGKLPAKLPQKPSFSQTCSLLSQYLKEKRTFGSPEIFRSTAAPMTLYPVAEKQSNAISAPKNSKSMDLLGGFGSNKEDVPKIVAVSPNTTAADEAVPRSAQMTIFYGGQVIVFNDFSPEKAKEIMLLATEGSSGAGTKIIQQRPADLPIARRNSLHRFLEKRKDRVTAKSPYAAPQQPSKPTEKSWLSLAA